MNCGTVGPPDCSFKLLQCMANVAIAMWVAYCHHWHISGLGQKLKQVVLRCGVAGVGKGSTPPLFLGQISLLLADWRSLREVLTECVCVED